MHLRDLTALRINAHTHTALSDAADVQIAAAAADDDAGDDDDDEASLNWSRQQS